MAIDQKLLSAICKHADQSKGPPCDVPMEKVIRETGYTLDQIESKIVELERARLAGILSEDQLDLYDAGAIAFFNSGADAQTILRNGKGRTNLPAETLRQELGWTVARMNAATRTLKFVAPWRKRWIAFSTTDPTDNVILFPS